MATTTTKLRMSFTTDGAETKTITFSEVDPTASTSDIQTLANLVVNNSGDCLTTSFASCSSIELITTTTTDIPTGGGE